MPDRYRGLAAALEQARAGRVRPSFRPPRRTGTGLDRLVLPSQSQLELPTQAYPIRPPTRQGVTRAATADPFGGMISPSRPAGAATPSHGGLLGGLFKVLDFGRGVITSTLKETIDLFQGEAPDPSEWWTQATNHYGFGDLIRDERKTVGFGLSILGTATANPFMMAAGATVLADTEWGNRIVGFVGDVALDPLTYMGGMNVMARGWGSYRRAGLALKTMEGFTDDVLVNIGVAVNHANVPEVRRLLSHAVAKGEDARSLTGFTRALGKSDEAVRIKRATGLDTGLRIRIPGTGPMGQYMGRHGLGAPVKRGFAAVDRVLGRTQIGRGPNGRFVGDWFDAQRVRNAPTFHVLDSAGKRIPESEVLKAMAAHRRVRGRPWIGKDPALKKGYVSPRAALEATEQGRQALAVAGKVAKRHVEFRVPAGFKRGAQLAMGAKLFDKADFPKRAFKYAAGHRIGPNADRFVYSWYRSHMVPGGQLWDDMLRSGDPEQIAKAWHGMADGRQAAGRAALWNSNVEAVGTTLAKRTKVGQAEHRGLRKAAYHIVEGARSGELIVDGQLNKNSAWYHRLPQDVKDLDDGYVLRLARDMLPLLEEADSQAARAYGVHMGKGAAGEDVFEWPLAQMLISEEGTKPVARRMSEFGRDIFGIKHMTDNQIERLGFELEGRMTPASLKERVFRVDQPVRLPKDSKALKLAQASGHAWQDAHGVPEYGGKQFDWYLKVKGANEPFKPKMPSRVGASVRTQIDEIAQSAFGGSIHEVDLAPVVSSWGKGMSRDIAVQTLLRHAKQTFPMIELSPDVERRLVEVADKVLMNWDDAGRTLADRASAQLGALGTLLVAGKASTRNMFEDVSARLMSAMRRSGVAPETVERWMSVQNSIWDTVGEVNVMYDDLARIGDDLKAIYTDNYDAILAGKWRAPESVRRMVLRAHDIAARVQELEKDVYGVMAPLHRRLVADTATQGIAGADVLTASASANLSNIDNTLSAIRGTGINAGEGQLDVVNQQLLLLQAGDRSIKDLSDLARVIDPDSPAVRAAEEARGTVFAHAPAGAKGTPSTRVARQIEDYEGWLREVQEADRIVGHQAELKVGVLEQVDMQVVDDALRGVEERTGKLLHQTRLDEMVAEIADPKLPRRTTIDSLRLENATGPEVMAAAAAQSDDARMLFDEAVMFRTQSQSKTEELVARAQQLGAAVEVEDPSDFPRIAAKIRALRIPELNQLVDEIEVLRTRAFTAELSAQSAAREAANILDWSQVGREAKQAIEAGGRNVFDDTNKLLSVSNEDVKLFSEVFKDMASNFGPWRMASGNAELNEGMMAAAYAFQKMNTRKEVKGLLKGYDAFQNWWKAGAIATPGFVNRNIFGAFYNAWLSDVDLNEIVRAGFASTKVGILARREGLTFMEAARRLAQDNDYFKDYVRLLELGVRGKGQATQSVQLAIGGASEEREGIRGMIGTGLRWAKSGDIFIPTGNSRQPVRVSLAPWSSNFVLFRSIRSANMQAEDVIRLGVGMDTIRWGGTVEEAIDRIAMTQFDYSELTDWERDVGQRLIPFYTWTRKNVAYQLEMLGKNPSKFNRITAVKRNLEMGTEDEGTVPDYYLEPFGIRLPFHYGGARVYSVPDIPFQDLLRWDPTRQKEGEGWTYGITETVNQALWQLSPIAKVPLERLMGTRIRAPRGVPFSGQFEPAPAIITDYNPLMPLLEGIGWARRGPDGWEMRDHNVYFVMNMLPTLGKLRRLFPSEERFQRNFLASWISSLGGISARPQTEEVQRNWDDVLEARTAMRRRREGLPPIPLPRRDPYAPGGLESGGLESGGFRWD